jgi:hypothetical protein
VSRIAGSRRETVGSSETCGDRFRRAPAPLKKGLVPAPELSALFATFTVVATLICGIPLSLGVVGYEGCAVIVVLNRPRSLRTREGTSK